MSDRRKCRKSKTNREILPRTATIWPRGGKYLFTAGALMASAAGAASPPAFARPSAETALVFAAFQEPTHKFEIEPGALDEVIEAFKKVTGFDISFSTTGIATLPSPGVKGEFTDDQALRHILAAPPSPTDSRQRKPLCWNCRKSLSPSTSQRQLQR